MSLQIFLSGVIIGLLCGILLGYYMPYLQQRYAGKQQEIDRLVEQFQELFRQLDQHKRP